MNFIFLLKYALYFLLVPPFSCETITLILSISL
jgi:hypothetical protein